MRLYYNQENPTNWNTFIEQYERPCIVINPIYVLNADHTKCPPGFPGESYDETYGYGLLFTILVSMNYQSFQMYVPHINTFADTTNKYLYMRTLGDGISGNNKLIPRYWRRVLTEVIPSKI